MGRRATQFAGHAKRVWLTRIRGTLLFDLVLPVVFVWVLVGIKSATNIVDDSAQSYANESFAVPTLAELLVAPTMDDLSSGQGTWYLRNWKRWKDRQAPNGFTINVAYSCGQEFGFAPNASATGFASMCVESKFVVIPADSSNDEQAAAAASFQAYWEAREPLLTSQDRFNLGPYQDEIKDESTLETYVRNTQFGGERKKVGVAIVFESGAPDWRYKLRVDRYSVLNTLNVPGGTADLRKGRTEYNEEFVMSGFATIQIAVDQYILLQSGAASADFAVSTFPMPTAAYQQDEFWVNAADNVPFFFLLAVIAPFSNWVKLLVKDKETHFKELLTTMGLSSVAYWGPLLLFELVTTTLVAFLVCVLAGFSVFPQSDKALVLMLVWSFFLATMSFGVFLSSLFSRASLANIVALSLYFLSDNLRPSLANTTDLGTLSLASLFPVLAMGLGIQTIGQYERVVQGVTMADPGTAVPSGYTVTRAIALLLFDTVLYLFLGLLIDSVGSKNLRFPWSKQKDTVTDYDALCEQQGRAEAAQAADESGLFEELSQAQKDLRAAKKCVLIHGLHKTFNAGTSKEIKAINGLTATFFENEISVLLGHNGAGKSTTDNVLTGVLPPTSGSVYINGHSVQTELNKVRQTLGICPQKNVLVDNLTVQEHLELMASVKLVNGRERQQVIKAMIGEVGLTPKTKTKSKALSGGMKRKLQLAMALIGDNKVVILDEPSSGMDTFARVATQRCIERHREGRTIILTTHYMDEADVLGDRVVVMNKGVAQCAGSTLFLKSALGVGYQLVVQTKKDDEKQAAVVQAVRAVIPAAEEPSNSRAGNEVILRLPLSGSSKFEGMLGNLESQSSALGIINTALSVTTLESVFLRLAEAAHDSEVEQQQASEARKEGQKAAAISPASFQDLEGGAGASFAPAAEYKPLAAVHQFVPLFLKRAQTARRDARAWFCQLMIPLVFMILGFLALNLEIAPADEGYVLNRDTDDWNNRSGQALGDSILDNIVPYNDGQGLSIDAATTQGLMADLIMPRLLRNVSFADIGPTGAYCRDPEDLSTAIQGSYGKLIQEVDASGSADGVSLPQGDAAVGALFGFLLASEPSVCDAASNYSASVRAFSDALEASRDDYASSRYAALLFNILGNPAQIDFTVVFNFTAVFATPLMVNRVNEALVRQINDTVSITLTAQTLPQTNEEDAVLSGFAALLTGVCLSIAFSLVGAGFAVFIVREKENKSWHQQLVNGINPWSYWASNFVFDLIIYGINMGFALILIQVFKVEVYTEEMNAIVLLLVLFGLAIVPFTYCFSFLFSGHVNAQQALIGINILGGFVLGLASFIMGVIPSTQDINDKLVFVYRILPSFCFSHGLITTANKLFNSFTVNARRAEETPEGQVYEWVEFEVLDLELVGWDVIFLAIHCAVFSLLLVFLQLKVRTGNCVPSLGLSRTKDNDVGNDLAQVLEDEQVKLENERVLETAAPNEEAILVRRLRKRYPNGKVAVKELNLGIHRNEVFGLLGTNGAGKTTALSIISGEQTPSNGEIFVDGIDAIADPVAAQASFGFCPQFDALFELLSGRECLEFYARIKGIPKSEINRVVNRQIERFGLGQHAHRLCGTYSGGNKRKLSVAQATLGAPKVVILDEPSAGLDVAARQQLHVAISEQAKVSTVVITTHSMEECEALSDRIAIMVDGRLRTIGTAQRIKDLYGHGFQLDITFKLPNETEIQDLLQELDLASEQQRLVPQHVYVLLGKAKIEREAWTAPGGTGAILEEQLNSGNGFISAGSFVSWLFIERAFLRANDTLSKTFAGVEQLERLGSRARFSIPFQKGLKLSAMFGKIEKSSHSIGIETYSLGIVTLEQVFNQFAATQSASE